MFSRKAREAFDENLFLRCLVFLTKVFNRLSRLRIEGLKYLMAFTFSVWYSKILKVKRSSILSKKDYGLYMCAD